MLSHFVHKQFGSLPQNEASLHLKNKIKKGNEKCERKKKGMTTSLLLDQNSQL